MSQNVANTDKQGANQGFRRVFVRPAGHECSTSSNIFEILTFGTGVLDANGFWEHGCYECARSHEEQFPEDGPCWPHTDEQLRAMGLSDESTAD